MLSSKLKISEDITVFVCNNGPMKGRFSIVGYREIEFIFFTIIYNRETIMRMDAVNLFKCSYFDLRKSSAMFDLKGYSSLVVLNLKSSSNLMATGCVRNQTKIKCF